MSESENILMIKDQSNEEEELLIDPIVEEQPHCSKNVQTEKIDSGFKPLNKALKKAYKAKTMLEQAIAKYVPPAEGEEVMKKSEEPEKPEKPDKLEKSDKAEKPEKKDEKVAKVARGQEDPSRSRSGWQVGRKHRSGCCESSSSWCTSSSSTESDPAGELLIAKGPNGRRGGRVTGRHHARDCSRSRRYSRRRSRGHSKGHSGLYRSHKQRSHSRSRSHHHYGRLHSEGKRHRRHQHSRSRSRSLSRGRHTRCCHGAATWAWPSSPAEPPMPPQ